VAVQDPYQYLVLPKKYEVTPKHLWGTISQTSNSDHHHKHYQAQKTMHGDPHLLSKSPPAGHKGFPVSRAAVAANRRRARTHLPAPSWVLPVSSGSATNRQSAMPLRSSVVARARSDVARSSFDHMRAAPRACGGRYFPAMALGEGAKASPRKASCRKTVLFPAIRAHRRAWIGGRGKARQRQARRLLRRRLRVTGGLHDAWPCVVERHVPRGVY
jgi:hypothetical protein